MTYWLRFFFLLCCASTVWRVGAQPVIAFRNASLEGEPRANTAPHDWYYCSFPGESPPDVHPKGLYRVQLPAADGATYVGLVCRDNGTFESIGQHLPTPLLAETCYRWRLRVARTPRYQAIARSTLRPNSFSAPVRLAIYGGSEACGQEALLGLSDTITFSDWYPLDIRLRVPVTSDHLRIGVVAAGQQPRNGHVLIDAFEPLVPCDCSTGEPATDIPSLSLAAGEPDWQAIISQLDRHLRQPRTGMSVFRYRQQTHQGLPALARLVDYLERTDRRATIGVRLGDRAAFRTVRQQLRNRLRELELAENQLRFRRLNSAPNGSWVGASPDGILYLRSR